MKRAMRLILSLVMFCGVLIGAPTLARATGAIIPDCDKLPIYQQPATPFQDFPERRYFPETRHSLYFGFKHFWEHNGGLTIFGFPLEEEHVETLQNDTRPRTVQRFERARFEYHPEFKGTSFEVELGLSGREEAGRTGLTAATPFQSPPAPALDPPFQGFWYANGGLSIFGYPISQPFTQYNADVGRELVVQYFERVRMEIHPERGGAVLLGRLGGNSAVCRDPATGAIL